MTTFALILAGWSAICLIAWALVRGGSMVERRDEERRIRMMEEV